LIGPIALVGSFFVNPAPPADASVAELALFAHLHHLGIVLGAWLQAMGSLLIGKAVQRVFLIAPALLVPLGFVLVGSHQLPRVFAYSGLAFGCVLQILGFVGLFGALQQLIDVVLIIQALWFVAASVTLMGCPGHDDKKVSDCVAKSALQIEVDSKLDR
jgi:hypothetical protein